MTSLDATLQLALAANVSLGAQLDVLGLGWEIIGPSPLPGWVIILSVKHPPGEERNVDAVIRLLDSTGAVVVPDPPTGTPVEIAVQLQVHEPRRSPEGLPAGSVAMIQITAGLSLEPGIYTWRAEIPGMDQPVDRQFYVRAKPDEFPLRPDISIEPVS